MIDEVSISNYKSVLNQRFCLGRVNIFVGKTGSGKTNILEALGIAAAAHDDALNADNLLKRGIQPVKPSMMIHSAARLDAKSNVIEIAWYERNSWKKAKLQCDNLDDANAFWKDISWYEPTYIEKINNLIQYIGDGTIEGRYPFADESKNAVLNAAFRGSRNFRDYRIFDANANDLKKEIDNSSEMHDEILRCLSDEHKQELVSAGFEKLTSSDCLPVFSYLSLFADKRSPSTFAIDNIEALIAPDVCCKILKFACQLAVKQNKQAFITTNNPAVVTEINLNDPTKKFFTVKMTQEGQTVVEELKDISLF